MDDAIQVRALAAAHLRKLFKLIGRTKVGIEANTGRASPELAPGDLWRMLPGLIDSACDLATMCGIEDIETDGLRQIARIIDGGRAPQGGR